MDKNKSIDGLRVRSAKKPGAAKNAVTVSEQPLIQKKKTKTVAVKSAPATPKKVVAPKPKVPAPTTEPVITAPREEVTNSFVESVGTFEFDKLEENKENQLKTAEPTEEKPKKSHKKRRIILAIVLSIIGLIITAAIVLFVWGNDIIMKITGGKSGLWDVIGSIASDTYDPLQHDEKGRTNILAFGTSGYDMQGTEGDRAHDGAQLTDSIMVISLDQKTGDIAMLSLPRDLKLSPTCTATGKINEIFWCNNIDGKNEEAGATALMNAVGDILKVKFQYYVHINWGSLVSIVDTLGGIKVTLDEDIHDYNWTKAVFDAGVEYELNGEQALALARARHGTTLGDFSRGNSQQKILIGLKNRIYERNDLSVFDLANLAGVLGDNLRTSFSFSELKTLAHLTSEFDLDSMRQVSLLDWNRGIQYMTTAEINGISYVVPAAGVNRYQAIQNYINIQFDSSAIVREQADILILNGTETVGLAASEQKRLEDEDYHIKHVDNAPEGVYPGEYSVYALSEDVPETVKELEKLYNVTAKTELPAGINGNGYDIVIILGTPVEEEQVTE